MFKVLVLLALSCHIGQGVESDSISNESISLPNEGNSNSEANSISEESHELEAAFGRRIIGGQTAKPGELQYVARLSISFGGRYSSLCSGTVLSNRHILTAAHCVYSDGRKAVSVLAQLIDRSRSTIVFFSESEIYVHPKYNEQFADDVAILKLSSGNIRNYGTPPLLPDDVVVRDIETNPGAVTSGWGKTSDAGSVSYTLQYVNVNIIKNEVCQLYFGSVVTPNVKCTLDQGKGICGGDSGGPLLIKRGRNTYVVGINAFGSVKCESFNPSGYTYVLSYMTWIRSVL